MIRKPIPVFFLLGMLSLFLFFACQTKSPKKISEPEIPDLRGEYLGQTPPGMTAELFAPGYLSTEMNELNAVFFPGGKEVIFSVTTGPMRWALVMMREDNGRWTAPEVAPFSGPYGGVDPFVSHDGKTVFFCSNRPRSGSGNPEEDYDIWYVTRTGSGWSEPVNPGGPINTDTHEFYPALTQDGTLYFQSRREGGLGAADIYRSRLINGKYEKAEHLPAPVNSPGFEGDAFISPDESYIIVSTFRAEDNIGQSDLYISFQTGDNIWGPMQNMGAAVNSAGGENCQILSPCGKYLFFTSRRYKHGSDENPGDYAAIRKMINSPQNGFGDAYWIDAGIIEKFRPKEEI
jgi:Tol biopolymer transport system component